MAVERIEVTTTGVEIEAVEVLTPGLQGATGVGGGGGDFQYESNPGWTPAGTGPNVAGALRLRSDGVLFLCSVSGTPGQWWQLSGFTLTALGTYPSPMTYPSASLFPGAA